MKKRDSRQAGTEVVWTRRSRKARADPVKVTVDEYGRNYGPSQFAPGGARQNPIGAGRIAPSPGAGPPPLAPLAPGQSKHLFSSSTDRLRRLEGLSDILGTSGPGLGMNPSLPSLAPREGAGAGAPRHAGRDELPPAPSQAQVSQVSTSAATSAADLGAGLHHPGAMATKVLGTRPPFTYEDSVGEDSARARAQSAAAPSREVGRDRPPESQHPMSAAPAHRRAYMTAADMMMTAHNVALEQRTRAAAPHGSETGDPGTPAASVAAMAPEGSLAPIPFHQATVNELLDTDLGAPARMAQQRHATSAYARDRGARPRDVEDPALTAIEITSPETGAVMRNLADVVNYYLAHGNQAQIKIFYLNPDSAPGDPFYDPYEGFLVPQDHVARTHLTVSIQGVVRVLEGEAQFTELGNFIREKSIFGMIRNIKFFRQYHARKYFNFWRKMVRWQHFRQKRQQIAGRLFLVKPAFQDALLHVLDARADLVERDAEGNTLTKFMLGDYEDLNGEAPRLSTPDDFEALNKIQNTAAMEHMKAVSNRVMRALKATGEEISAAESKARDQVQIDKRNLRNEEALSISAAKAKRQERHKKHQQAESDKRHMAALLKLADTVMCTSVVERLGCACKAFLRLLESKKWRPATAYKGVFETRVVFPVGGPPDPVITPSQEDVIAVVDRIIDGAVDSIASAMPRLYGPRTGRQLHPFLCAHDEDPLKVLAKLEPIDPVKVIKQDDQWRQYRAEMHELIAASYNEAREQLTKVEEQKSFKRFIELWRHNPDWIVEDVRARRGNTPMENMVAQMRQLKQWIKGMERVKRVVVCGALSVDMRQIKEDMLGEGEIIYAEMFSLVHRENKEQMEHLHDNVADHIAILGDRPTSLEKFVNYYELCVTISHSRAELMQRKEQVEEDFLVLDEALKTEESILDKEKLFIENDLQNVFKTLVIEQEKADQFIVSQRPLMVGALEMQLISVDQKLLEIVMELNTGKFSDPDQDAIEICDALSVLDRQLKSLEDEAMTLHKYGQVLNLDTIRDEQNREQAGRDLQNRVEIWNFMKVFRERKREWQLSAITSLELGDIKHNLDEMVKNAYKMTKLKKDDAVAVRLAQEIDDFRETQPLLELAANKALQLRHWEAIFNVTGRSLPLDDFGKPSIAELSLHDLREMGIGHESVIRKADAIQAVAIKENGVQQALRRMQQELKGKTLTVLKYKDPDVAYKLGSIEEILQTLDEQVMTVQTIVASPFSASFKDDARKWERHLLVLQDLVDHWMRVQVKWLYLEPIFQSQDIGAQLPDATTIFMTVDTQFQELMHRAHEDPAANFDLSAMTWNEELVASLLKNLEQLEEVHKALSSYLDAKRLLFPRFFFLSDDEMLEILSKVRDATRVEPHLRKSFEGISRLRFEGKPRDPAITAIVSLEGETVDLTTPVFPREAGGSVEKWLNKLEKSMFQAVKVESGKCMGDFNGGRQLDWVLRWPQMSVLVVSQLFWTRGVEEAIEGRLLPQMAEQCQRDVHDLVEAVRGDLDPLARLTLSTLLVQDVHARDIVHFLADKGVADLGDFDWQAQLRTYFEASMSASRWGKKGAGLGAGAAPGKAAADPQTPASARGSRGFTRVESGGSDTTPEGTPRRKIPSRKPSALVRSATQNARSKRHLALDALRDGTEEIGQDGMAVALRMMDARIEYGYEYLGNSTRLVLTPLTDRCYRTLTMSYQLNLGGAPEGPAGTGKTETTKDLAKTVARHCLVFNCSEELDYLSLGKFFKGLCATGAWACFDEFNRIDMEVLSVAAQQITTIQTAIATRVFTLDFEGTHLQLKHTAWVGVTMNPSYAGRNELPDNLKGRFRAIAMMVPDYIMISEIMLFSEGYVEARECAQKIVQCYKLCSEQLSSQDHYDYGMRAVIAVLRAAGMLKRKNPGDVEQRLILRALLDVNLCKFVAADIPLFQGIIADLFPDSKPVMSDYSSLRWALRESCLNLGIQPSPYFLTKCIQVHEMVAVRHGLMLVGKPLSGKTTVYRTLAQALTLLHENDHSEHAPVEHVTINPKAMTIGELFGRYDRNSHEYHDGVLADEFRKAASKYPELEDKHWLVMDGPVDAMWIENLNTVLDDNKKLCLLSGEIIRMSPTMAMLFEVMDLSQASPATISRCGMVYTDPNSLGWQPLVLSWLEKLGDQVHGLQDEHKALLLGLFNNYLPVCLKFVSQELETFVPVSESGLVTNFMHMYSALSSYIKAPEWWDNHADAAGEHLQHLFVHALIWSMGGVCATDRDRQVFSDFLRALVYSELKNFTSPSGRKYRDGMESGVLEDWRSVLVPIMQGDMALNLMDRETQSRLSRQRSLAQSPVRGMDVLNTAQFRKMEVKPQRQPSRIGAEMLRRDLGGATSVPPSRQVSRGVLTGISRDDLFSSPHVAESALDVGPEASTSQIWKTVGRQLGVGGREAELASRRQTSLMEGKYENSATSVARKEITKDHDRHINLIIAEEAFRDLHQVVRERRSRTEADRGGWGGSGAMQSRSYVETIAEEDRSLVDLGEVEASEMVSAMDIDMFNAEGSLVAADVGYSAAEEAWLSLLGTPQSLGTKLSVDSIPMTREGLVFDYFFDPSRFNWVRFSESNFEMPTGFETIFRDIMIPTPERAMSMNVLATCIRNNMPVLFVGPTGTGKTAYVKAHLDLLDPEKYSTPNVVMFTAKTTARKAQKVIESKLDRRRRGVLGPPLGKTMVLFVDDLNMPQPEEFGAQPPLEMLRSLLDQGGLYIADRSFHQVTDQVTVAAMGPTGGGRNAISERLLRHFFIFSVPEMAPGVMQTVFEAKLGIHLANWEATPDIMQLVGGVVQSTIRVFEDARAKLMPTPSKSHYIFSTRDVARVIEGMTLVDPEDVDGMGFLRLWIHETMRVFGDRLIDDADHQWLRGNVLGVLLEVLKLGPETVLAPHLGHDGAAGLRDPSEIAAQLVFSPLTTELKDRGGGVGEEQELPYGEVTDMQQAMDALFQGLDDYNSLNRKPLSLSVFQYAVQHVTRVMRILRLPGEHLMQVGVGGTGRRSLTKLAAFMAHFAIFEVVQGRLYSREDWKEDVKRLLGQAGAAGRPTVFLFNDQQFRFPEQVEHMSALLQGADVPGLLSTDDMLQLTDLMEETMASDQAGARSMGRAPTFNTSKLNEINKTGAVPQLADLWGMLVARCKKNLHIVLQQSPDKREFRDNLRMYPALLACCQFDWYHDWPDEALHAVASFELDKFHRYEDAYVDDLLPSEVWDMMGAAALVDSCHSQQEEEPEPDVQTALERAKSSVAQVTRQLSQTGIDVSISDEGPRGAGTPGQQLIAKIIEMVKILHSDTQVRSQEFLRKRGRHNAVTPKMYVSLFSLFQRLLERQGRAVEDALTRFRNGLQQLEGAQAQIRELQTELTILRPQLEEATGQAKLKLEQVAEEQAKVEEYKKVVDEELQKANKTAAESSVIRSECEARLEEALPAMEEAIKSLDTIDPKDMRIVQSFKSPPEPIKLVLQAVMALLRIEPIVSPDPNEYGKKIVDYWTPALRMLQDPNLLKTLKEYDKDNIDAKIIAKVDREYLGEKDFKPERVAKASAAMAGICKWVLALRGYDSVAKEIAPKRAALAKADDEYRKLMEIVRAKQDELDKLLKRLALLQQQADDLKDRAAQLQAEIDSCTLRIQRAERLILGLTDEHARWGAEVEKLAERKKNVVGDMLLCAGVINYLGAFTKEFRDKTIARWERAMTMVGIRYSKPERGLFSITAHIGDPVKLLSWHLDGLPNDSLSDENAIIAVEALRVPLLVDPVGQATNWLSNMLKEQQIQMVKAHDKDVMRRIENAIQIGWPVLVTEIEETLDTIFDAVLDMQIQTVGGEQFVRMGDANIKLHPDFRLFMGCMIPNPHFLADTAAKVTVVNFAITEEGLGDQLLSIMLAHEKPALAQEYREMTLQTAANAQKLKELENDILRVVSEERAPGSSILDDEEAISIVQESKRVSAAILEKNVGIREAQLRLDEARQTFHGVGMYAAMLFFCTQDLQSLEPMYVFSLDWFTATFVDAIEMAEKTDDQAARLDAIQEALLWECFAQVCTGLFARDKLTFAALISFRIITRAPKPNASLVQGVSQPEGGVDGEGEREGERPRASAEQVRFLLTGGQATEKHPMEGNPPRGWLPMPLWTRSCRLAMVLGKASGLVQKLRTEPSFWEEAIDQMDETCAGLPVGGIDTLAEPLSKWECLLVVRALRPDLTVRAMRALVSDTLGERFTDPPQLDMSQVFERSTHTRPMLFLLAPGLDPVQSVYQYAERMGMKKRLVSVSLGQGQGPKAERVLLPGVRDGDWVVLQNAHLSPQWLLWLERFVRNLNGDETNQQFRLLITSMPTKAMPLNLLLDAFKICSEPPQGMRANMQRCLNMDAMKVAGLWPDKEEDREVVRAQGFGRFVFALAFLHAVVKERRSYGPAGWNVPYSFSDADFTISLTQLKNRLGDVRPGGEVPFQALKYIIGEINYGGKVTDDRDRLLMTTLLESIFTKDLLVTDRSPAPLLHSEGPFVPQQGYTLADFEAAVARLPFDTSPESLGMHRNADVTKDLAEANALLEDLAGAVTGSSAKVQSDVREEEQVVRRLCTDMASRLPRSINRQLAEEKYPADYAQSMNQVVCQEVIRYNLLLDTIRDGLNDLTKAVDGIIIMTQELDDIYSSFLVGVVPKSWLKKSFPSLKPLASYFDSLIKRVAEFDKWVREAPPVIYWISGFFFTHSFLTAVRQNYARRHRVPIDTISFQFKAQKAMSEEFAAQVRRPSDGVFVHGLFLEGAAWCHDDKVLVEARARELYSEAPVIFLHPGVHPPSNTGGTYDCPVYRTTERKGVLKTTGHSSNYVIGVDLPCSGEPSHWVLRGTCMTLERDE